MQRWKDRETDSKRIAELHDYVLLTIKMIWHQTHRTNRLADQSTTHTSGDEDEDEPNTTDFWVHHHLCGL